MLFIIDMQNDYIDQKQGRKYVPNSEEMAEGIIEKIKEAEEKGEYIFYTIDIPILRVNKEDKTYNKEPKNCNDKKSIKIQEEKSSKNEEWCCEIYTDLKPYVDQMEEIKKSYYAIPPEVLFQLQNRFKDKALIIEEIELAGVETHICVLANAICLQSAFPEARIVINSSLCKSSNIGEHKKGLEIMESLGMKIRR